MTSDFQDLFYSELNRKIRFIRKDLKLTQFDFAENLGLSRASIVNIEKGRQKPTIHLLFEIAQLAKIDMNYFFNSMPDKNAQNLLSKRIEKKLGKDLNENAKNSLMKFFSEIVEKNS